MTKNNNEKAPLILADFRGLIKSIESEVIIANEPKFVKFE